MIPPRTAHALMALAAALAMAAAAPAALWVSPGGDDRGPGTEEQPLRTIEKARDVVRTMNRDMADDITVFIAGAHHVDRAIEFGPEDSGTNGFNIVYTAAPGEHPVLSGGIRVTGWSLSDRARGLWVARAPDGLGDTHELFVDGTPASRTRGRLLAVFAKNTPAAGAGAPDPRAHWKNPADIIFGTPGPGGIWSERAGGAPSFVENAFELLGAPGDWYFDRPARLIYYTPRAGEDMARADVVAASTEGLVAGSGTAGHPVTGLIFKGLRFEYTTCLGDSAPGTAPPAAVRFAAASAIQFLEDEFVHMATPALDLGPGVEGALVDGCLFADIAWQAVRVSDALRIRIAECRFTTAAWAHIREAAIDVGHSDDVAIEHCQVDHFPTAAILVHGGQEGALRQDSNLIAAPMVGFMGVAPGGGQAADPAAGLPAAYRELAGERFGAAMAPRPPTGVSAEPEDEFAYVTWLPSGLDGGSPVTAYTVTCSSGAKAVISAADFQAKGYVILGGLDNGHPVSFTVAATSAGGTGPASLATANVTPFRKRRLKPPAAPAGAGLSRHGPGSHILITPPPTDGGSPVIAYGLVSVPDGARMTLEGLDVVHADLAHPVERRLPAFAPPPGATISIVARNTAGDGPPAVLKLP